MSEQRDHKQLSDGTADAIAATAITGIFVLWMYLWLSGMPS